ncbi:amidohydrolase [Paraflavitalea pollutisoli]|uniref:amidohydrolase n=1 Tax=Paraflavitalea pollutisoli TaxID=3034143 RepID=UPI0023EB247C|nr:amidohydrolase [Paraflavitalea sp. H1-2-19X]
MMRTLLYSVLLTGPLLAQGQQDSVKVNKLVNGVESKVIAWRRDLHQHPELGNRETRTAEIVAKHLRALGLDVTTGVGKTGVVGILKGGQSGPVVALRADMDALPVTERTNLPFASTATATYNGNQTGVMHACGHDAHVSILMGVAEVLTSMKQQVRGTVKFIFQPAEEGAPAGEEGGAKLMIKEGVLQSPQVEAIFGLHMAALTPTGQITYRPAGTMASACDLKITVMGKSSHGAFPWGGVDPILVASQIVVNLQSIVSRNLNVTENAGVVSIGSINGGNRYNIIPEKVEMLGTVRALSPEDEKMIFEKIKLIATKTAEAAGATATVEVPFSVYNPVNFNNVALTNQMLPSLRRSAGESNVVLVPAQTIGEDFAWFAQEVPGLFIFLGALPPGTDPKKAAPHHTAEFFLDESSFKLGVKALTNLVLDYPNAKAGKK